MTEKKELGNRGELLAKQYLVNSGYEILGNNYRVGHLEIDLIAKHHQDFVFVEVKTRIDDDEAKDEPPLRSWQTKNIKRALVDYCFKHHINLEAARLDLIVILVSKELDQAKIKHYEDIF